MQFFIRNSNLDALYSKSRILNSTAVGYRYHGQGRQIRRWPFLDLPRRAGWATEIISLGII